MKKSIELSNRTVEYTFRPSARARRIWLTVRYDGSFVVSAPVRMKENRIRDFIRQKSSWIIDKLDYYKKHPGVVLHENKRDLDVYKDAAFEIAERRLAYFNQFYNFKYRKITIRNQTARWGSCSKIGNLSFNYQIALLPPQLSDYIVVHELCHLGEFNHSKKFWELVEKTIPDHRAIRREIAKIHLR